MCGSYGVVQDQAYPIVLVRDDLRLHKVRQGLDDDFQVRLSR